MQKGRFLAFEGLDGAGKTTQMGIFREKLLSHGIKCRDEREPSGGILGLIARGVITKKIAMSQPAMALLFAADRYEHIREDIKPYIDAGEHVVTDRFVFSSFAYQGLACDFGDIYNYNKAATGLLMPDLTVFLDIDPETGAGRIGRTRVGRDLFDDGGDAEKRRVRENFFRSFELFGDTAKVAVIDATLPAEEVSAAVWKAASPLFGL